MKLRQITENDEYEGLEDDDEFMEGCIYCGMTPDVTDIIQFDGEDVCVDCIEERPMYEWLRDNPEKAKEHLWKLTENELAKDGEAYGLGNIEVEEVSRHKGKIKLDFTVTAHSGYYNNPQSTAEILAARVKAARNASSTARGW